MLLYVVAKQTLLKYLKAYKWYTSLHYSLVHVKHNYVDIYTFVFTSEYARCINYPTDAKLYLFVICMLLDVYWYNYVDLNASDSLGFVSNRTLNSQ